MRNLGKIQMSPKRFRPPWKVVEYILHNRQGCIQEAHTWGTKWVIKFGALEQSWRMLPTSPIIFENISRIFIYISNFNAHSRNHKFTEVVIYFVIFLLIRTNINGTSDKQGRIQDCFPRGAVTWSQWPGGVWGGICALLNSLKSALFISNEILAILISIPLTFPIFDAVTRTI